MFMTIIFPIIMGIASMLLYRGIMWGVFGRGNIPWVADIAAIVLLAFLRPFTSPDLTIQYMVITAASSFVTICLIRFIGSRR